MAITQYIDLSDIGFYPEMSENYGELMLSLPTTIAKEVMDQIEFFSNVWVKIKVSDWYSYVVNFDTCKITFSKSNPILLFTFTDYEDAE